MSAAADAAATCPSGGCQADPARLSLTGVQADQAIVAVIAVLAISGEYSTGMIRIALTAMPRRLTVLAAKAVLITGLVLAVSAAAVLGCVLAGRLILPGHGFTPAHGYPPLSLGTGPVLRAACGSVLYLALIALLSLGVATAVRESAAAIGLVLGLLYAFPLVTSVVSNQHWQRHLEQIGPMTAGLYIQATANLSSLRSPSGRASAYSLCGPPEHSPPAPSSSASAAPELVASPSALRAFLSTPPLGQRQAPRLQEVRESHAKGAGSCGRACVPVWRATRSSGRNRSEPPPPETSARERWRLWRPAGVRTDEISGIVITWGLRPPDGNRWSAMKRDGPRASQLGLLRKFYGRSFPQAIAALHGPLAPSNLESRFSCAHLAVGIAAAIHSLTEFVHWRSTRLSR